MNNYTTRRVSISFNATEYLFVLCKASISKEGAESSAHPEVRGWKRHATEQDVEWHISPLKHLALDFSWPLGNYKNYSTESKEAFCRRISQNLAPEKGKIRFTYEVLHYTFNLCFYFLYEEEFEERGSVVSVYVPPLYPTTQNKTLTARCPTQRAAESCSSLPVHTSCFFMSQEQYEKLRFNLVNNLMGNRYIQPEWKAVT